MVVIIDGNQLACRCYFSLDKLTTSYGKRTETIYGFLGSFKKLIKTYKDSTFFLAWDGGNDTRKSIYPAYKAGRKNFEDAFYEQLDDIRKIVKYLGIKQYHIEKIEADDIIGTLAIKSRKKGKKVLIVSSDHDFEQLISRHILVLHPLGNNIIKDEKFVFDTYGIGPCRLVEVMSITGDSTDNIPGIDKVGGKTAAKLILANGNLESILKEPEKLKILNKRSEVVDATDNLKEKIKANIDNIKIANQLVKINCNLDLQPDFTKTNPDYALLKQTFEKLEFEVFLNEFRYWKECFT
jgi:DNA polymerase-1